MAKYDIARAMKSKFLHVSASTANFRPLSEAFRKTNARFDAYLLTQRGPSEGDCIGKNLNRKVECWATLANTEGKLSRSVAAYLGSTSLHIPNLTTIMV